MKKRCLSVVFLCLLGLFLTACHPNPATEDIMQEISSAPVVKLEYAGQQDAEPIFADNVGSASSIAEMNIQPSDQPFDEEWIYRFTYNPPEKVLNSQEIIVLFGSRSMSVDGTTYLPEEGVDYDSILEWAEGLYQYYTS